jgi:F-type H+-transporting ATPase subunit a
MPGLLADGEFPPPITEEFEWPSLIDIQIGGLNLSINRPVLLTFLATAAVAVLFWLAFRKPKTVPGKLQNLMEAGVGFVRDEIIYAVMGREKGARWVPYLTTLFFFVLIGNLFSILPLVNFPVNFRSANTWMMAILSLGIFIVVGFRAQGAAGYLKSVTMPPGVPKAVLPLMGLIEFVSTFLLRPLTLSVRLLGNMIAGHFLLLIFWGATAFLLQPTIAIVLAGASFVVSIALLAFELAVATLQAYIFTILTAVYIAGAYSPEH